MQTIQDVLTAGATIDFSTTVEGYLASDGWTLNFRLAPRDSAGTAINIVASADGDGYKIQIGKAVSAGWGPGFYTCVPYVTKAGELYPVGAAKQVQILPDPTSLAVGHDGRSHVQKTLDAIQAVIQNRASVDQKGYTIGGRRLDRMDVADLVLLEDRYLRFVAQEKEQDKVLAGTGYKPRMIGLRFSR